MTIGYKQYVSNEISLMNIELQKQVKFYDELFGDSATIKAFGLVSLQSLHTREFIVYFMQNQEELVEQQKQRMRTLNIQGF